MPKLLHIEHGVVLKEYPLDQGGALRIGRGAENDIQLDDPAVSSRHALITVAPSPYMEGLLDIHLDDLDSTNGTRVHDTRIEHHRLKHGDVVRIGTHLFKFVDEASQMFESTRIYLPEDEG